MSLGGELMRFGLAEWSGARQLVQAGSMLDAVASDSALVHWTAREVEQGESASMRPVVVCDSTALARSLLLSLPAEDDRGVLLVGTPDQWPATSLPRRSPAAGLLADLLPGVPVDRVAWLGMNDASEGLLDRLALAAHEGGLTGESIELYVQVARRVMSARGFGEVWFVVFLDSMAPHRDNRHSMGLDVMASVLGAFDSFVTARGIVLVSSAAVEGSLPRATLGVLAKRLGGCLARRPVPPP